MFLPFGTSGGSAAPSGAANLVYATPNGSSGAAALRALVTADLPLANATGAATFEQASSALVTVSSQEYSIAATILAGDCVVVFVCNQGLTTVPLMWVRDNGGNNYSCMLQNSSVGSVGGVFAYVCFNARAAATSIHVTSTATGVGGIAYATYSGVKSLGATNNANPGATTAGTISLTTTAANSIMCTLFMWGKSGTAITVSALTGNIRTNTASNATPVAGLAIVDNTQASIGSETCAVTASAAPTNWAILAIELIHN